MAWHGIRRNENYEYECNMCGVLGKAGELGLPSMLDNKLWQTNPKRKLRIIQKWHWTEMNKKTEAPGVMSEFEKCPVCGWRPVRGMHLSDAFTHLWNCTCKAMGELIEASSHYYGHTQGLKVKKDEAKGPVKELIDVLDGMND